MEIERVASVLAKNFMNWGVSHVFGIPGKAVVPLIVEIDHLGLNFVLSKHECGAGYEAAGYSLLSGKVGIAIGTSGPGGTNLLTAAGQAKASHLPVIFITGHPSIRDTGKALGQDSTPFGTDLVEMFKPVTKFSARVERGDLVESYLKHALEKAFLGVKGPVHLLIPADVLMEEITPFELNLPDPQHVISPKLNDVIELLVKAERPVMFLGKGVHSSKAYEEVKLIAEHWNIPVMTTPGGKGTFISTHPLSLGAYGLGGNDEAHQYIEQGVDLMLVMGTKLSDMSLAGFDESSYPDQVIHFDYDPTFVQKSLKVPTLFVGGDIKSNLQTIINNHQIHKKDEDRFQSVQSSSTFREKEEGNPLFMSSQHAIEMINYILPKDSILFGDDGSHSFYAIKHFDIKEMGTFFFDDVFGAMGNAIGYSIGAKLADRSKIIVCLTGDGCMLMHGSEISTAVNSRASVIFIVLNNQGLDMVDKGMQAHLGKSVGTKFEIPIDISQYAQSMGALSFKCRQPNQLKEALIKALMSNETTVIEVVVDRNETPPTMRRG